MQTDYQKLKQYYYNYYNEHECTRYLLNNINNRPKLVKHTDSRLCNGFKLYCE